MQISIFSIHNTQNLPNHFSAVEKNQGIRKKKAKGGTENQGMRDFDMFESRNLGFLSYMSSVNGFDHEEKLNERSST
jgi:hypothetical protein